MKCPVCQKELQFQDNSRPTGSRKARCTHELAQDRSYYIGCWVFTNSSSEESYVLNFEFNGMTWGCDSQSNPDRTDILLLTQTGEPRKLAEYPKFIPLQENLELYHQMVQRIIDLKAFL